MIRPGVKRLLELASRFKAISKAMTYLGNHTETSQKIIRHLRTPKLIARSSTERQKIEGKGYPMFGSAADGDLLE